MTRARIWATTGSFVLGTFFCLAVDIISKETAVDGVIYPIMLAVALTIQRWK